MLGVVEQQQPVVAAPRRAALLLVCAATVMACTAQAGTPAKERQAGFLCCISCGSARLPAAPVSGRGNVARLLSLSLSHPERLEMSTPESAGLSATPAIAWWPHEGRGTHRKPCTTHCCGRRGLLLLLSVSYYPPPKRATTLTAPGLQRLVAVGLVTVALTTRLLLLVVALRPPRKPVARIVAAGTRVN